MKTFREMIEAAEQHRAMSQGKREVRLTEELTYQVALELRRHYKIRFIGVSLDERYPTRCIDLVYSGGPDETGYESCAKLVFPVMEPEEFELYGGWDEISAVARNRLLGRTYAALSKVLKLEEEANA